jgi:enoyl-CoA hydratase/carnithine racemase
LAGVSEDDLRFEVRAYTAIITFNRPAARNAMTWDMYERLAAACEQIDADETIRVAVLRGAGGTFVSGTDIRQFHEFSTPEDGLAYERRTNQVLDRVERVRVPTIAAVEGYAAGGGLALASCCDLRICTPDAKFGLPIARTLGNCVSMPIYARLADLIGPARALHLIYTATFLPADRALAAGLASEVVPDGGLDGRLEELCDQLANHAPLTMWASKEAFRRLREAGLPDDADLIAACYGSDDFQEGVRAFIEKRPARWLGR